MSEGSPPLAEPPREGEPRLTPPLLRYPAGSLLADHARAAGGLGLTAGPLALLEVSPWIALPMGLCAGLFALFGARSLLRHGARFALDGEGVRQEGPFGSRYLRWSELSGLSLRYYALRRGGNDGWMQMTLSSHGARIRLDSTLDGFDAIAERAARAALRNGVPMTPATLENFLALGIDPEEPETPAP
ncbi:PH domain-containing protein [Azospirillum sp. SYSU D00513]|uniref:PH domain-containing protein n=1 Tax=Azospirillum sp. SYSU D00513 TaxID=2812561 RepID=UPI001A95DDB8|nr:PH domain-containing protein [Azospirillum sp. SYSU D00513]